MYYGNIPRNNLITLPERQVNSKNAVTQDIVFAHVIHIMFH
jgi:hypothetical protein